MNFFPKTRDDPHDGSNADADGAAEAKATAEASRRAAAAALLGDEESDEEDDDPALSAMMRKIRLTLAEREASLEKAAAELAALTADLSEHKTRLMTEKMFTSFGELAGNICFESITTL